MKTKTAMVLAFVCLGTGGLLGQTAGKFTGYGPGHTSCGKWADRRNNSIAHLDQRSWVLGFITGSSWMASAHDVYLADTDSDAIEAWLDQRCAAQPLLDLDEATRALVIELVERRKRG